MSATPQTQAINEANDLLLVVQQIMQLQATIDDHVRKYVATNVSTTWNAMGTAAANTDGSLAAADGSVNNAHPIDTRLAGASALAAPLAANDLVSAEAILQLMQDFFKGTGSTIAVVNRNLTLAKFRAG